MFHRFPIGKYSITQHIPSFGRFYKNLGRLWWGVWLWRISGGYSQEMMGLFLKLFNWI